VIVIEPAKRYEREWLHRLRDVDSLRPVVGWLVGYKNSAKNCCNVTYWRPRYRISVRTHFAIMLFSSLTIITQYAQTISDQFH